MYIMWTQLNTPPAMPGAIKPEDKIAQITMMGWAADKQRMKIDLEQQKAAAKSSKKTQKLI
jgi:hypothetical protein